MCKKTSMYVYLIGRTQDALELVNRIHRSDLPWEFSESTMHLESAFPIHLELPCLFT